MTKKRRFPLSLTLLPLIVGGLIYWYWWNGQAEIFAANIRKVLGPTAVVDVTGFPYRMEADFGAMALSRITPLLALRVSANELAVNRAPVGRALTVISARTPVVGVQLGAIEASKVAIAGASSRTSLRFGDNGVIARLSTVFEKATVRPKALAYPAGADRFEVHVRETPQALDPASRAPTFPQQAQLVLEGEGVRYAGGDPVMMTAQIGIEAKAPLRGSRAVLAGATLQLEKLELRDKQGIIATMAATASPDAAGQVLISGTVDTVCPRNVVALLNDQPGVSEKRARRSQKIAFSGPLGSVVPTTAVTDVPVRNQEPPCPVLRR